MKKKWMMASACVALAGTQLMAQTQYDAALLAGNELNGTARFVGMGGAMSALGADISVIGVNPAGIGLFRSNELTATLGLNHTRTESAFGNDIRLSDKRTRVSFDQAGFVYSSKIGNYTDVRFVNFAFNYHKSKNFNRRFQSGAWLDGLSQTQQMANMMSGSVSDVNNEIDAIYNYNGGSGNPYSPNGANYPYLGVMGVRTELVSLHENPDKTYSLIGWNGDASSFSSHEEGGIQQYDFNVSFNVSDRMYFGATVGVYDVNYNRSTYYTEDIYDGNHSGMYELMNDYRLDGVGVDFKLGAIFRPLEDSPFRFGLAVHTPTWYVLTEEYVSGIRSDLEYSYGKDDQTNFFAEEYTDDYVGNTVRDYRLRTPWKFNVSAGTVLDGVVALGAEYEYADHSSSKLYYDDGYEMKYANAVLKEDLKGVHTVRVGMESRLTPDFSLRAGYNYQSSGFRKTAYKALADNDMRTDTEYTNDFDRHTVTCGLGYRGKSWFADVAYKYDFYQSDFYAFSADALSAAKVNTDRHQVLMTVGVRF